MGGLTKCALVLRLLCSLSQVLLLVDDLAHDCELNFLNISKATEKAKEKPEKVFYKGNPFLHGIFLSETSYLACGYDKAPFLFQKKGAKWEFVKIIDEGIKTVRPAKIAQGAFE